MRVAIFFNQFGPYHYARLNAAGKKLNLFAIELFSKSMEYEWGAPDLDKNLSFDKRTLFDVDDPTCVKKGILKKKIYEQLYFIKPDVVAINGWSEYGAYAALKWCIANRVPAILMSDSTEYDFSRSKFKEAIKKQLVKKFSSALVGGKPHVEYVHKLGMPVDLIFQKYDVVDNQHFSSLAENAKLNSTTYRKQLNLPDAFFLASSRFIPKKNLMRLLQAYSIYRSLNEDNSWGLVLLGDGTMRTSLVSLIKELNILDKVHLPGFKQYFELPIYFGLANAFVHASTTEQWGLVVNEAMASGLPVLLSERCGCAANLLKNEENGLLFNPFDPTDIAEKMNLLSSGKYNLRRMSEKSLAIISDYTPEHFAESLKEAAKSAISSARKPNDLISSLTLDLLIHQ